MDTEQTCCFIGHRKMNITDELSEKISRTVEDLIRNKGVTTFLFGSKSEFNWLCKQIVTDLKEKYPQIKRVYVRAEFEFISEHYREYLLELYEDTYFPKTVSGAGRASYIKRNQEMIERSNYCIFYYHETDVPAKRKSGTKIAYEYARKRGAHIINVL